MKNFIFISPNFPAGYWKFCSELKKNGMRVLGIGDCPYGELTQNLRDSLHEYYK
ncbi:MAG: carbamoylphosphate synthase large subunit, partial [Firmicutes bacterium]|nr:carbamoylphosphate synthase large subunit [Bacillota bacterium]